ncbi:GH92 family glycosyl hydrolase [Nostoc ellipsosporum NOK]|nr:GH92 family glycosyl hydrolase [Nostoc ellipsosporum NOK]
MRQIFICLFFSSAGFAAGAQQPREAVDYIDPMIGTTEVRWMQYPGPSTPFSMVKLSPDNKEDGTHAGYNYATNNIAGFSHIHSWAMAGLLTMPANGPLKVQPGKIDQPDSGYRSRFDHADEKASAGYYSVLLKDYGIKAELTSTCRTGFQRYTFPASSTSRILFDLKIPTEYPYEVDWASIKKVSDYEIEGFSKQQMFNWFASLSNDYTIYFVARVDKPMRSFGTWVNQDIDTINSYNWGHGDVGAFIGFHTTEGEQIQLKTGISFVSIEEARRNLAAESDPFGWDFEAVRNQARNEWAQILNKIEVEGGTEDERRKFYTNFYRAYCSRTTFSDASGKWIDMCEQVRQLNDPSSPMLGSDAFWGAQWNLNQLWSLVTPRVTANWVRSFLEMYDKGGWLPNGPIGLEYCDIMVGHHEMTLINSAYQKGIRDFDAQKAYEAMRKNQEVQGEAHPCGGLVGNRQLDLYKKLGYVPDGSNWSRFKVFGSPDEGPTSNTIDYAYDDWNVAQMAKALGKEEDYRYFIKRAYNYRNVFDSSIKYFRRKDISGKWLDFHLAMRDVEKPRYSWMGFVEGNAFQYSFFLPHDVNGLIAMVGRDSFNARLSRGFEYGATMNFRQHGSPMPAVNHGNQPGMQSAYLYNYSGKPWLTQYWVREIINKYYGLTPQHGWPGDEDEGQGGAWLVMSAIGLFQMDGGGSTKPIYEIGSPIFRKITIHLDEKYYPGKTFVIEAKNVSDKNRYIRTARLNGRKLSAPWFYHEELIKGGKLELEMSATPDKKWGTREGDAPPSMSTEEGRR